MSNQDPNKTNPNITPNTPNLTEQNHPDQKRTTKSQTSKPKTSTKKKIIRTVTACSFLLLLGANTVWGTSIYGKFQKTLKWDNTPSATPMAKQATDVINDPNPVSRKAKLKFNNLVATMLTNEGDITNEATDSNIKKLESYLSKIVDEKRLEQYKYKVTEIKDKKGFLDKTNSLFTDDKRTTLNGKVTPETVKALYTQVKTGMQKYLDKNSADVFMVYINNIYNKLSEDTNAINAIIAEYNKGVTELADGSISINQGYASDMGSLIDGQRNKLHFEWLSLNHIYAVTDLISADLDNIINVTSQYKAYEEDISAKNKAFADWGTEQTEYLQSLKNKKLRIIQENQEAKQKAEEAKKQEEAKQKAEEEDRLRREEDDRKQKQAEEERERAEIDAKNKQSEEDKTNQSEEDKTNQSSTNKDSSSQTSKSST